MKKTVLVPIDFSLAEPAVTACAVGLAKALQAHIVLLHVEAPEPGFMGYEAGPQTVRDSVARSIHGNAQALHKIRDRLRGAGVEVDSLLIQGPTVEKIVDEAKRLRADFIVAGSHGHGAIYDLVVGSVSDGVIRHAPCPVVVVPRTAQPGS
jgi:nucleotide-binding universal stress UspA family protein